MNFSSLSDPSFTCGEAGDPAKWSGFVLQHPSCIQLQGVPHTSSSLTYLVKA